MKWRKVIPWVLVALLPVSVTYLAGCADEDEENPPPPPVWQAENSTCVSGNCHGSAALQKAVPVTGGGTEYIPLYVDSTAYVISANPHKSLKCLDCHTGIHITSGNHGPDTTKEYGGWARFSKQSGTDQLATVDSTRNYSTSASTNCRNCHSSYYTTNAGHIAIPRLRGASVRDFAGHQVGEPYSDRNCSRCHATCGTCHFKSTITPADSAAEDIITNWDLIQRQGDNAIPNTDNKTQYRMDWTTNVRTHEIRKAADLEADNVVCRSCHLGYYRPAQMGYVMRDGQLDSMMATGVRRHPQYGELRLAAIHGTTTCVECHGSSLHSQVSIAQGPECVDCHSAMAQNHPVPSHAGYNIKCIACHTTHRASDFDDGYLTAGQSNWINPENHKIEPVVVKYNELLEWYPHRFSKTVDCNKLCHFQGNRVGATPHANEVMLPPRGPVAAYQPTLAPGESDE